LNDDVHPTTKNNDFNAYLSSPVDSTANVDVLSCGSMSIRAGDVSGIRETGRLQLGVSNI